MLYPFIRALRGKDISINRNRPAKLEGIRFAPGPDGQPDGSVEFSGRPSSYIRLPNTRPTKDSITLLIWIFSKGTQGPIFHFTTGKSRQIFNPGMILQLSLSRPNIVANFLRRRGRRASLRANLKGKIRPRRWYFIGLSYNKNNGIARLYVNNRVVARKTIGSFNLATNFPVRMGAVKGNRRWFRGRVSCLQLYKVPLTTGQIAARARRCFSK